MTPEVFVCETCGTAMYWVCIAGKYLPDDLSRVCFTCEVAAADAQREALPKPIDGDA